MAELLAVQREFAAALRDSAALPPLVRRLEGDAALAARRFAIYRANRDAAILKTLTATYPVVRQVVGGEFFDALAAATGSEQPSRSGDLNEYGAEFATFLEAFPPAQGLPYLPDLARLEWAVHQADGAADGVAFDAGPLADLSPAQQDLLTLNWAPGTALVDSAYPVARVWQIHQSDHEGEFSVDWTVPQCALVARTGWRVSVQVPAAGERAFIGASLNHGAALAAATEAALAADPAFDLAGLLGRAIASGLICSIDTPKALK